MGKCRDLLIFTRIVEILPSSSSFACCMVIGMVTSGNNPTLRRLTLLVHAALFFCFHNQFDL